MERGDSIGGDGVADATHEQVTSVSFLEVGCFNSRFVDCLLFSCNGGSQIPLSGGIA